MQNHITARRARVCAQNVYKDSALLTKRQKIHQKTLTSRKISTALKINLLRGVQ